MTLRMAIQLGEHSFAHPHDPDMFDQMKLARILRLIAQSIGDQEIGPCEGDEQSMSVCDTFGKPIGSVEFVEN